MSEPDVAHTIDTFPDGIAKFIVIPNGVIPPDKDRVELMAYTADIFQHFPRILGEKGVLILPRTWANFMQWFLHRETVHCLGGAVDLYVRGGGQTKRLRTAYVAGRENSPRYFWSGSEWNLGVVRRVERRAPVSGLEIRLVEHPDVITCTREHVFFSPEGFKIEAQDLWVGDKLKAVSLANPAFTIPDFYTIKAISGSPAQTFFDVTVDNNPVFALPSGVLTHNSSRGSTVPLEVLQGQPKVDGVYEQYITTRSYPKDHPVSHPNPALTEPVALLLADSPVLLSLELGIEENEHVKFFKLF